MHDDTNDTTLDADIPVSDTKHRGGGSDLGQRVAKLETHMSYLATKEDMQSVRADIQSVRTDMESMLNKFIRWAVGTALTTALAIIGAVGLLLRLFN